MEIRWHHVAMAVRDMDRIVPFYRDLLGFEVDWEKPHYSGEPLSQVVGLEQAAARVVMLKGHGGRMEIFQYLNPLGRDRPSGRQCDFGLTHVALEVKGIHAIYDRLRRAGINAEQVLEPDKLGKQIRYADRKAIPYALILGPDELAAGQVVIKTLSTGEQVTCSEEEAIARLKA